MLTFITTVRHPSHSNSYERVWQLLTDTVGALLAQTDPDVRVVVVCDRPLPLPADDRILIVPLDWPPVDPLQARLDYSRRFAILDKGRKYAVGIAAALDLGTDQIMFVDADDFVACDLAEFVNANRDGCGWYIDRGYLLTPKAFTPFDNFHRRCGTSNIARADLLEACIPPGLDSSWPPEFISTALDPYVMLEIFGNHKEHAEYFGSQGHTIERFPVRSAVWNLGTGENTSDVRSDAASLMGTQPAGGVLTEADRQRFSIPRHLGTTPAPGVPRI